MPTLDLAEVIARWRRYADVHRAQDVVTVAQVDFATILDAAEAGMRTHSVLLDCLGYVEEGWLKERIREALKEKPHD